MDLKVLVISICLVFLAAGCEKKEPKAGPGGGSLGVEQELRFLQNVVKDDPNNINAWIKLGNINMDMGKYQDAVASYSRALELDPNNLEVRVDMGSCYRYMGMPEKAIGEYKKALAINPDHPFANKNMAIVLAYDMRKYSEAAEVLDNYLKKNPGDPDAAKVREEIRSLRAKAANPSLP